MNSSSKPPQRRHFSRIGFRTEALLRHADRDYAGRLIDLSLRGALVDDVDAALSPGDSVLLTVSLDGQQQIQIEAEVAHREHRRVGLRCVRIDIDSVTHLRRLVELNLGDDSLLNRELAELVADT